MDATENRDALLVGARIELKLKIDADASLGTIVNTAGFRLSMLPDGAAQQFCRCESGPGRREK